jgi:hypothetical protein
VIWRSVPVIAGGIIPRRMPTKLMALGVRAVYTPKDFSLNTIMADMVDVIREGNGLARLGLPHALNPHMTQAQLPDPEQLAARILRGERAAVASGLNLLDNKLAAARDRSARLLAALSGERALPKTAT